MARTNRDRPVNRAIKSKKQSAVNIHNGTTNCDVIRRPSIPKATGPWLDSALANIHKVNITVKVP